MKENITEDIALPESVTASTADHTLTIKGPKGEVARAFQAPGVALSMQDKTITLTAKKATKREKKMLYSFRAHINNMIAGVQEPWEYTLKICSGHFPMTADIKNSVFSLKNFLGEKIPRQTKIPTGVDVKVAGADITVTSPNKELAGRTANNLEQLTRITDKDLRRFQDGIYITKKSGKEL